VYYWESLEALQALMKHPKHIEAKREQGKWLDGYQVIVSEVIRSYGDGKINHPAGEFDGTNSSMDRCST
jgi:heme-degrading monooxygenase HmoA